MGTVWRLYQYRSGRFTRRIPVGVVENIEGIRSLADGDFKNERKDHRLSILYTNVKSVETNTDF